MDWFAKHEPVCKRFNFLSNLFTLENPSRLTLKHEPVRKHFSFLNNLFNHEKISRKWIGSQAFQLSKQPLQPKNPSRLTLKH